MKILLMCDSDMSSPGGVQQYVRNLSHALRLARNSVIVVGPTSATRDDSMENLWSVGKPMNVPFNGSVASVPIPTQIRAIAKQVKDFAPDLVHINIPYLPTLAHRLIRRLDSDIPLVGTFHVSPYSRAMVVGSHIGAVLTHKSLARVSHLMSVSPSAQSFCRQILSRDSLVVPPICGAGQPVVRTGSIYERKDYVATFVGRLVPRKDPLTFVRAAAVAVAQSPDMRFGLVGSGPLAASVVAEVERLGLSRSIDIHGAVTDETRDDILRASLMSVYPSVGGESYGIVILESVRAGSVVLAAANPGYSHTLENDPRALFPPRDFRTLGRLISSLAQDPRKLHDMVTVQQYLISDKAQEIALGAILNVYREAVKNAQLPNIWSRT